MNACGGMGVYLHTFLTLTVEGGKGLASYPSYFILRKDPVVVTE